LSQASSSLPGLARTLAGSSLAIQAAAVLAGSLFIALAAQITVPMLPVPMTMQTFAVLLVGLLFGPRLALATLATYLVEGAVGLPVFQGAGSIVTLIAKPATTGYLAGFLVGAWLAALIVANNIGGRARFVLAVIAAECAIYAFGLPVLGVMFGWDKMLAYGFTPFILGDALKAVLAVAVATGSDRLLAARG